MTIHPEHVLANHEAIQEVWNRRIARFAFVPHMLGFAVESGGEILFVSSRCTYERLEEHWLASIRTYTPVFLASRREWPNQVHRHCFRNWRDRFLDVRIQSGVKRIEFTFFVALDLLDSDQSRQESAKGST